MSLKPSEKLSRILAAEAAEPEPVDHEVPNLTENDSAILKILEQRLG